MIPSEKLTVLVVDDVQENVEILIDILDELCDVSVALSGPSALELIAVERPDLILLDIMMPQMDGYEVCRKIKQNPKTHQIPVIFITALDTPKNESKGLSLGAIDYITKPFNPAVVKTRVQNHLALCKASRLKENVEQIIRHDLKNPLNFIMGVTELMIMDNDQSEHAINLLTQLNESAKRMLDLIDLSLDTFKMEQGRYCPIFEPVDLLSLLDTLILEQRIPIQQKKLRVTTSLDGMPPAPNERCEVMGKEILCYTLLGNLMKNAIEASPPSSTITIALTTLPTRQVQTIRIHNVGAVPETIKDRFFDKYVTFGKQGGTGIGTYSAALITKTLDGEIRMESDEHLGTSIYVVLPAPVSP